MNFYPGVKYGFLLLSLFFSNAVLCAQGVSGLRLHAEPDIPYNVDLNDYYTSANAYLDHAYGDLPDVISMGIGPTSGDGTQWVLQFSGTTSGALTTGTYNRVGEMDVDPGVFDYSTSGIFVVHEITFDSSNDLSSAWVTFVQYFGSTSAAVYGDFRYNADTNASAGPIVDPGPDQAVNGGVAVLNGKAWMFSGTGEGFKPAAKWSVVSGPGPVKFHDAGSAVTTAALTVPGTYMLRLTARAGALANYADMTVTYSDRCTSLYIVDGSYFGQVTLDTAADGPLSVSPVAGGLSVSLGSSNFLYFAAPSGSSLTTGTYTGAQKYAFASGSTPALMYIGTGGFPDSLTGSFIIKELVLDSSNNVTSFWATFTEYPAGSSAPVTGEVRVNADSGGTIVPGVYEGLATSINQPGGATVSLNSSGAFTGAFDAYQSRHHVIRGAISPASTTWSGLASSSAKTGVLNTTLQINADGTLCGVVHDDQNTTTILTLKRAASKGAFPSLTGKYTMALVPDASAVLGDGIGFATVDKTGKVRFVGALPDGKDVSCAGSLAIDESIPYAQVFRTYGIVAGWVQFADLPDSDFSGTLVWNYSNPKQPNGQQINAALSLAGCRWNGGNLLPGLASLSPNAQALFTDPNWQSSITLNLDIGTKVTASGQGIISANPAPGIWSGAFKDPTGDGWDEFVTIFLQKQNKGYGLFRVNGFGEPNIVGYEIPYHPVTITPVP